MTENFQEFAGVTEAEVEAIKSEAVQFTDEVKDAKTISEAEIDAIKERIASDFYFDPEVIDKIVDKLVALPNFK